MLYVEIATAVPPGESLAGKDDALRAAAFGTGTETIAAISAGYAIADGCFSAMAVFSA